ncbi:aspartate aminotransferase family protein [Actinosynnema mirum]|uniref:Aminotransferase class-III n=1 Tax=Actinosynnema mirum (strain ATCC 29888 / DSM 43827 / JCM 3225 / NBRC 14064 / NCIMB 13271 / NRRL B-12336 / IMRU 3971 / 101) TaxID=446462 RepID=C6WFK9_ACTMD|nr:aspartate aminotransferase family protein [Actinosynnema mirum]ACU35944.1 aminotransferase class-III [Actinosynnema mirum DSM 43827]
MTAHGTRPGDLGQESARQGSQAAHDAAYYGLGDALLVRGEGVRVWDESGREYLDCVSGTFNLVLGHNHPEVVAAVKRQADELVFASSSFQTAPTNRVLELLAELAPNGLDRVNLRSAGGSTANEGAIKMAQWHTGKRDVVVPFRGHLGQTIATASYNGTSRMREPFPYHLPGAVRVPDAYCHRCFYGKTPDSCGLWCVDRIEDFLRYASSGSVAAMVVEPISGVGGNIVPPPGYLARLREFCTERGIVLVFDENQTGLGRTGSVFAADHFGVTPDVITVSKGLTGSGLPLAAIITTEELVGMPRSMHGFTYGGHTLSAAAAVVTLEIVRRPEFLAHVREAGSVLLERLRALEHPALDEVRGVGLMLGVELAEPDGSRSPRLATALQERLAARGVVTRVSEHGEGNVIELRPPLVLSVEDAHLVADRFGEALDGL